MRELSLLEARVLGVLIEKAHTVPDSYPLSLNSLVSGCNQKTTRDPVMNATEAEVQVAADALKALHLVFESSGSRVTRYEHNMARAMALPSQSVAVLAVLMLRGPQTSSELRANCDRLHRFADVSSVEAFLDELAARAQEKGGPLVLKLPRAPGAREARWTHLLCGAVDVSALPVAAQSDDFVAASELASLKSQQLSMQRELDELRALIDKLYSELGVNKT
ncbi:MAG: YceH family protein [Rhizobacter sp.]|nr:YceH family protein [Rhizobacter sp.]